MKYAFLFCLLASLVACQEKEAYRIKVKEDNGFSLSGPVSLTLPQAVQDLDKFQLVQDGEPLPFQKAGDHIWFLHNPERGVAYSLEAVHDSTTYVSSKMNFLENQGNLELQWDNTPVLQYRYAMTYPPSGVDSLYAKSGYIHPICTPKGDTLTRIQPPDHYHHYGLWGPWTHTRIDTTRVDFWNLGQGMGTVLFKEFKEMVSGDLFSSFTASQEHIDLKTENAPQVALNENVEVRLWNLERPNRYMFDYNTNFSSPLKNGILFEAYRYGGGIGLRFTERWHKDNCTVLTSEGKDRLQADGSNARWCIVSGESSDGQGTSGILFMSHPENRMHPEPMRIWPVDANGGRGDMFFEFCPIRHTEWKIEPNMEYGLQYRMVVFDGELTAEEAEAYWQVFANPLKTEIIKN
ncbi:MAG: PmoA family protein [Bacteroidota bacterium]